MWANFLNFFAFLLLLLALKLFINILAKFNRPLAIRYLLLIGSLGFFCKGLGYFYLINFEYSRWLIVFPNTILASSMVLILAHLKDHKIKTKYFIYIIFMILTHLSILFYFSFLAPLSMQLSTIKYASYFKTIRYIFTFTTFSLCFFLFYKIIRTDEIISDYRAKLKLWYLIISFFLIIAAFTFSAIDFSSINSSFVLFLNICMNILYLLAILFRPSFMNNSNNN
jgi:hypothetical protein